MSEPLPHGWLKGFTADGRPDLYYQTNGTHNVCAVKVMRPGKERPVWIYEAWRKRRGTGADRVEPVRLGEFPSAAMARERCEVDT